MTFTPSDWPRVKAIFAETVEWPPAERSAHLDATCADRALRAQVEALLASHDAAGAFLDLDSPEGRLTALPASIGPYPVIARLGAGGMGEVYLAHDARLNRQVAIKVLPPDVVDDADKLRRFEQEARAASSLNHPHILVIHDFGEAEGRPFIVTEYVEGHSLRERLAAAPMASDEAITIAAQVAGALSAAHSRGIIHRDIKPENIMVRPDGYVKVLDFGLAKLLTDETGTTGTDGRTRDGAVLGTPRYMSPEQLRGLSLDASTDVWSLGVVLYEMVSGRPPFSGATIADLTAAILHTEPLPLELAAPRIPVGLGRIVTRALQKERTDRYSSAGEISTALNALLRQVEYAGEPAPDARLASQKDAHSTPPSSIENRTRLIVLPFRMLRSDPEFDFLSFGLADAIALTLSGLNSLIVRSSLAASRFGGVDPDPLVIAREAGVDVMVAGTLLRAGTQLRVSAQLLTNDGTIVWSVRLDVPITDVIRVQDELTERIVDSLALPLSAREQESLKRDVPASAKAYELYLRGSNYFYDGENWRLALDLLVESVTQDPGYAPAWARLGRCYRLAAKFTSASAEEMRENLTRADIAFQKAFDLNPDLPIAHQLYTAVETDLGRGEDAMLRLVRRARRRRGDPELYAGLVHACRYCGLLDASLAADAKARALDPHITTSVAQTYWMLGEYERALECRDALGGFFAGLPLVSLGREAEAIEAADQQSSVVRDPTTRSYQRILPLLLQGRTDECLRLLDSLAPRNPDPESVFYIARTYLKLGAIEAGVAQFARAVDMGFFPVSTFEQDPWLQPTQAHPIFRDALARARARHAEAARRFRDAGGERLLSMATS